MKRILPCFIAVLLLITILPFQTSRAATMYTTDSQDVNLRSGPSAQNRAIATLPPGTPLELVKTTDWAQVKYTDPSGEVKQGFVLSRLLGPSPPESTRVRELASENTFLKEQLAAAEKEKAALLNKEKDLSDKLAKLEKAHEELRSGSTNYLKLKSEYDAAKSGLATAQENIQSLIQENENLKLSQRIQWFASGAAVLLVGWFLGWMSGRIKKKRRSSYFF
ncbi:MAG: TIGR04211 family SH3 domain-containing protein [Syntrophobacteraceae bacterium]|nr:TIGR04211 family SH3 domain-containing protein [Syntrophobacteraceae bacterium]